MSSLETGSERRRSEQGSAGAPDTDLCGTKAGTLNFLHGVQTQKAQLKKQVEALRKSNEELRRSNRELERARNEYAILFDLAPVGYFTLGRDGIIKTVNRTGAGLVGMDRSRIVSRHFGMLVAEADRATCADFFGKLFKQMGKQTCRVKLSNDRNGPVFVRIEATATESGQECHAVLIDITEKRAQELQLIQAEKMSSIGLLAAGVAHEINNPLTSVAGYAEALLRRFRDDPALEQDLRLEAFPKYLEVIVRESYQCKGIIDNLLNFSRKSDGVTGEVDLNLILSEILELLTHQPGYGRIEVATDLEPELPRVPGDPSGPRQVFMNLLYNAFQSIKGVGRVQVTARRSGDGRAVCVRVRDTGCGITPELMERIWDPFFTTKEIGKGLGLGLALTRNIVEGHGGRISVESRVDEGSQFTVRLPVPP